MARISEEAKVNSKFLLVSFIEYFKEAMSMDANVSQQGKEGNKASALMLYLDSQLLLETLIM